MLKIAYKKFWVPVMGRIITKLIPMIEGKPPKVSPTYDIDNVNKSQKWVNYLGNEPPWQ